MILDASAPRHKLSEPEILQKLQALEKENPGEVLESQLLSAPLVLQTLDQLSTKIAASREAIKALLSELENQGKVVLLKKAGREAVIHCSSLEEAKNLVLTAAADFHKNNSAKLGIRKAELKNLITIKLDPALLTSQLIIFHLPSDLTHDCNS